MLWRNLSANMNTIRRLTKLPEFIVLSIHATGYREASDIIEMSLLKCHFSVGSFCVDDLFSSFFNTEKKISKKATALHGITNELLKEAPFANDCVDKISDFIGDIPVLAYWDGEIEMVKKLYKKNGKEFNSDTISFISVIKDVLICSPAPDRGMRTVAHTWNLTTDDLYRTKDRAETLLKIVKKSALLYNEEVRNRSSRNLIQVRVLSVSFFPLPKGLSRIYVNTNDAVFYYIPTEDRWNTKPGEDGALIDINQFDMADLEKQVFVITNCSNYDELKNYKQQSFGRRGC